MMRFGWSGLAVWIALLGCGDASGSSSASGGDSAEGGAATGTGAGASSVGAGAEGGAASSGTGASAGMGAGTPQGKVPVFVAQGHMGRTTISCDDGRTWIADHSDDDNARCFTGNLDCDHAGNAGRGLAFGDDAFIAAFGWGHPGTLQRSTDGIHWTTVASDTPTFADVAFGNGVFVADNSPTQVSSDGSTWSEGGDVGLSVYNVRAISFVPYGAGLFVITAESGSERDIAMSVDGVTWTHPSQRPPECGSYVLNVTYGADRIAIFSGDGTVCTSADGGDTWQLTQVAGSFSSPGLWNGSELLAYEGSTLWRSPDGSSWTSQQASPGDVLIGAFARGDSGTYVAVRGGWQTWYEGQEFYRSSDGLNWEKLAAGTFKGSHPINFIEPGYVDPSPECPLP